MPSLSEIMQFSQGAVGNTDYVGAASKGVQEGIGLAQQAEKLEQQKQQTEAMKEQLDTAKFNKATSNLSLLARTKPAIASRMVPKIMQQMQAAGIAVDENVLRAMASDEEYKNRLNAISGLFGELGQTPEGRQQFLQAINDFGMTGKGIGILEQQQRAKMQTEALGLKLNERGSEKKARQGRFTSAQSRGMEADIRNSISKVTDLYGKDSASMANIEAALSSGNFREISTVAGAIAKNIGQNVGAQSDADVNRSMPKDLPQTWAGLATYLGGNPKASPEFTKALNRLVKVARENMTERYAKSLYQGKRSFNVGTSAALFQDDESPGNVMYNVAFERLGVDPEQLAEKFSEKKTEPAAVPDEKPAAPSASVTSPRTAKIEQMKQIYMGLPEAKKAAALSSLQKKGLTPEEIASIVGGK